MKLTKTQLREIIREEIQNLNEGTKLKMPKTAEEARTQAIEWQHDFSSKSMSWSEVIDAQAHFEKTAKKFKLTKEFEENGIL
ncbi:hypothetical protein H8D04_00580 [bacterium]|nr:hypothetical protein [bacterium]